MMLILLFLSKMHSLTMSLSTLEEVCLLYFSFPNFVN